MSTTDRAIKPARKEYLYFIRREKRVFFLVMEIWGYFEFQQFQVFDKKI
jgi:hypothetical protein